MNLTSNLLSFPLKQIPSSINDTFCLEFLIRNSSMSNRGLNFFLELFLVLKLKLIYYNSSHTNHSFVLCITLMTLSGNCSIILRIDSIFYFVSPSLSLFDLFVWIQIHSHTNCSCHNLSFLMVSLSSSYFINLASSLFHSLFRLYPRKNCILKPQTEPSALRWARNFLERNGYAGG